MVGDTVAAVGDLREARGRTEIDASGLAVAPGFINMLSWATESLIEDGRSQSDVRQGVTLDVFGEGWSEDDSRVGTVYFIMSKESIAKKVARPWVSFGSDAGSLAPEGAFLKSNPHPRAYGNSARLLGKYVREESVLSLEEAVRRLTSLPASNLKIKRRGALAPGYYADVIVFDPEEIIDHATFSEPHQYSTGVRGVFVNGVQVLKDGEHTGATPGRVVRGPGWVGWDE